MSTAPGRLEDGEKVVDDIPLFDRRSQDSSCAEEGDEPAKTSHCSKEGMSAVEKTSGRTRRELLLQFKQHLYGRSRCPHGDNGRFLFMGYCR